ncbi:DP-EP family protein [Rugamonas sp. FT82W]|uniref:DP-EP family protein n=1 Tax=Duganella vulcania TaxID=2692166 RepID=A0A845G7J3_9BURK|nr:DP-EP family protein [Duganella vulcania]MYM88819.1 DP-EP family protein [Duganella vulcania]
MSKIHASTQFINVMVKVKAGDTPGTYHVHTAPEMPYVTQQDTVINYQIYDDDHQGIVFTGMTIMTLGNDQLSAASVSISGKQLTFSDANTSKVTISFKLNFKDAAGVEFMHDPQVENDPQS